MKLIKSITQIWFAVLLPILSVENVAAQSIIYQHNFGTVAITGTPYTIAPQTLDANLSSTSWASSTGSFINYAGSTGQALSLSNSSGTPTYTLSIAVASGYVLNLDSFKFWRQRSTAGAQSWSMTVNGTAVGSGTVPTTGASTGMSAVSSAITGLSGTVTIVLSLSGASGAGTFRLDDFTLVGMVIPSVNPSVSFQTTYSSGMENTSSTDVPVEMQNISTPVTVSAALSGTATVGADYTINTTSINFGSNGVQNLTISPINNSTYNGDKTIIIDLTITSGTATLGISQHVFTLTDDETNPATVIGFDSANRWTAATGSALTSYTSGHKYVSDGWTFNSNLGLRETTALQGSIPAAFGIYGWRIKDTTGLYLIAQCNDTITVSSFGFKHRRWSGINSITLDVEYSIDSGTTWYSAASAISYANNTWQFFTYTITNPITTLPNKFIVRISKPANSARCMIDDFQFMRGQPGCYPSLISGTITNLSSICIENGWTYYGNGGGRYFAIKKGNSGLVNETVDITAATSHFSSLSTAGANKEHASFIMNKGWNVNGTIPSGQSVDVRFFYDPADTAAIVAWRNAVYDTLKGTGGLSASYTNANTLAVKTAAFEWFKSVGVPYDATWVASITGNQFPSSHTKLTPIYGSVNGVNYVDFQGITSFSGGSGGAGFGAGGGVGLPVTWAGFEVKVAEVGNVLEWKTASEHNTSHFEVEYSYDGKNFNKSSMTIPAAGTSQTLKTYTYTHRDFSSYVYYRIKQVDMDGRSEYSVIRVAKRTTTSPFQVRVYPIPVKEDQDLNVEVLSIDKSEVRIRMIDMTGKVVGEKKLTPSSDYIREKFNISNLSGGIYQIEVQNGQGREVMKFSK